MRQRSLSDEGHKLFNVAYQSKPTKKKIHSLLACLFHTADDDVILDLTQKCRTSSEYMIANVNNEDLYKWVNTFIQNILVLIMKKNDKIAKYHEAKKNFKMYLAVAKNAFKQGDHNTAWLMMCCFMHKSIDSLGFNTNKFVKDCVAMYGRTNNSFTKHILDVSDLHCSKDIIIQKKFIPIAAVLNMYSKKMHTYHKTYDDLGIKTHHKNKLRIIEDVVEQYTSLYKLETNLTLIPMYLEIAQIPGMQHNKDIPLGDLIELSKKIKQNRRRRTSDTKDNTYWVKNPLLRRVSI